MDTYHLLGIVGLLIIALVLWVRNEKLQDVGFILGGICLLAYSLSIGDTIFVILQIVFIISAGAELFKLRKR